MAIKGIDNLPIDVSTEDALRILNVLAEVNAKLGKLESEFKHAIVSQPLIQMLSLSESVESTKIEGTQVTFADMVEEKDNRERRWEIIEVENYQFALHEGFARVREGYPISTRLIRELHQLLMEGARGSTTSSGQFRKIQNYIGPTNRIEDATYIPPPAHEIDDYMANLEKFINGDTNNRKNVTKDRFAIHEGSDPLIKTAVMHAQFESIHPFLDGNGRLGRILIVLSLAKDWVISQPVFFVSEELEKEKHRYYDLLNGVRGQHPDWGAWILFFLEASNRMADQLLNKLAQSEQLAKDGLDLCETASERHVWLYTFTDPSTTAKKAANATGVSTNTARKALNALASRRQIYADQQKMRNVKYRNYDLLRILRD
ncbi:Fic family protein [Salicibibacter cibi]|uniref:Fic family protein n=1 Tax=Salicibibacter cibi TaxID=2743001 RepID=A0A7T6Z8M2_9BACI|nr:Fic family protein [Salicibibacter cibi]